MAIATGGAKAKATQKGRTLAAVIQGVDFDKLLLTSFTGTEGLSRLFRFDLDFFSQADHIDPEDVVGKKTVVSLMEKGKAVRHFIGSINRFSWTGKDEDFQHYHAEMVPWLWQLSLTSDCRIFQRLSVPEIVETVFKDYGFSASEHYQFKLTGDYTKVDYCVQYRETAFNFISRLLEQEGIFYYFRHEVVKGGGGGDPGNLKNLLVLQDSNVKIPGDLSPSYTPNTGMGEYEEDAVTHWHETMSLRPTRYTYRDYHFERSEANLEVTEKGDCKVPAQQGKTKAPGQGDFEMYDYPGEYAQRFDKPGSDIGDALDEGQKFVEVRMQEEAATHSVAGGTSNCRAFNPGFAFTLVANPSQEDDIPYLLTSVHHVASVAHSYRSDGMLDPLYQNTFTCIPFDVPFRPARTTPKPFIHGVQNAVVVGAADKEIDVDKWGRVKVQFPWDRLGKKNEESSCWVRVAQTWAGKRWGMFFWPRIGQEVLVAFQEGDPEEPIIVGSAYNDAQPVPYLGEGFDQKHPHEPNISGIKTNTTLDGKGFNELRFNDTKEKEQVFIHGQRDMDVRVRHDSRERVIHDRHLIVGWEKDGDKGGDQREMVYQDKHLHVHREQIEHIAGNVQQLVGHGNAKYDDGRKGGNVYIIIENDKNQRVEGNYLAHVLKNLAQQVDGNVAVIIGGDVTTLTKGNSHHEIKGERREKIGNGQSLTVVGDQLAKITGNNHLHVTADQNEKVEGTQSLDVGQNLQEKVGMNHALDAGQEVHIKGGMKVIIEAGMQLSLKGPGGFINIGPSGVDIQGILVNINSGGSAGSGSDCSPTAPQDPQPPNDASKSAPPDPLKAQPLVPEKADNSVSGSKSAPE